MMEYTVPRGMQYNWIKTLFTFAFGEEFDGKSQPILQRQN